jgi:hypothetical protein
MRTRLQVQIRGAAIRQQQHSNWKHEETRVIRGKTVTSKSAGVSHASIHQAAKNLSPLHGSALKQFAPLTACGLAAQGNGDDPIDG